MPEAAPSITRRSFFSHVAGAYTSATMLAAPAIASELETLIDRHRESEAVWLTLDDQFGDRHTSEQKQIVQAAYDVSGRVLDDLLVYRPQTLEEVRKRVSYLMSGPWCGCIPSEGEIMSLLKSLLPEDVQ